MNPTFSYKKWGLSGRSLYLNVLIDMKGNQPYDLWLMTIKLYVPTGDFFLTTGSLYQCN